MAKKADKKKSFEDALEELENVADELASGRLSIDEAIKKYEGASKTYKVCQSMLDKASKKIALLTEENGRLKTDGEAPIENFLGDGSATDEEH